MKMDALWIVTANAGRARIFAQGDGSAALEEINDMTNTKARLRTVDTESDQIGQHAASKSRHGVGAPTQPSGYEPDQTPADHTAEVFARDVASFLLQAHNAGRFRALTLSASPEFLGILRKQLDAQVAAAVTTQIDKDFTQFGPAHLPGQIALHVAKERSGP
jgi:protein required for attachment to host cells